MANNFAWYLGIDWGVYEHVWCLLDATGQPCGTRPVRHTADALHDALQWVQARTGATPDAIAVGLERPDGVLVDSLLDWGFAVFAINPKQLDRFRDRFSMGGAKDDSRDAHVAADALRTDRRAFRRLVPDDPAIVELREQCRLRTDLLRHVGQLANRLREQLARVDAAWLTVCPAADEPWLWTLLATRPHPAQWGRLGQPRLTRVLRQHRIRRMTGADLHATLRQPRLRPAPGVNEAVATRIRALVPQLQLVQRQLQATDRQIDQAVATLADTLGQPREQCDVDILRSAPGVGRLVTATLLTEATGPLAARDYAMLRAQAGTAPVTKRSGKHRPFVHMRYACNPRLRQAVHCLARVSIQHDPAARAYYQALRQRGHNFNRALRSVADRWLRILIAMLKTQTRYDPNRFASTTTAA